MPTPRRHNALLLLATLLVAGAAAQPNESQERSNGGGGRAPGATQPPSFSAPMVVLLVALIATFFFVGFFSIYIRQCGRAGTSTGPGAIPAAALLALSQQEQQQQNRQRGLDPAVIASFPTMTYAEARELRDGDKDDDAVLECAVCLSVFDDQEELHLLPKCSHAFHPDCIGEWLAGHVTCPVCRCSLDPEEPAAGAGANGSGEVLAEEQREVAIDVHREGGEEERRREAVELERIGSQRRAVRSSRSLSRAHSTGHSLSTRLDGDLERFTLRLPEHVRRGMVLAAGEESLLHRTGAREGRGAGAARSARIGRSDRWPSCIARTFSSRVPFWGASRRASGDAEAPGVPPGSTTVRTMRDQKTTAAAADGSVGSAKGSVRFDCLGGGGGGVSGGRVGAVAGDSEEEDEEKAIVRQA